MPLQTDKFTVLVVDDLKAIRFILVQILTKKLNMHVIEAVDGSDALEKIHECNPDLVFSDISMPVMDGIELVEHLRADEKYKELPVIILTALDDRQLIKKLINLRILDYMLKPFETMSAVHRIKKILSENEKLFRKKLPFTL